MTSFPARMTGSGADQTRPEGGALTPPFGPARPIGPWALTWVAIASFGGPLALAALNAVFTAWATVVDARRPAALVRALGARAGQVTSGLAFSQVLASLPGVVVGTGLGVALYRAALKGNAVAPPQPRAVQRRGDALASRV